MTKLDPATELESMPEALVSAVSGVLFRRLGLGIADLADITREVLSAVLAALAIPAEPTPPADGDRIYPCDDCGMMRTKAEGGTTFTVCDACWDRRHGTADAAPLAGLRPAREARDIV